MRKVVVASACLVGFRCRYDGTGSSIPAIVKAFSKGFVIPLCPEQLGGLPTPRTPAMLKGGDGRKVVEGSGRVLTIAQPPVDVTAHFLKGAYETLRALSTLKGVVAGCVFKEKSPSCGVRLVYDFDSGATVEGSGVTTALLLDEGFKIISSEDGEEVEKLLREVK